MSQFVCASSRGDSERPAPEWEQTRYSSLPLRTAAIADRGIIAGVLHEAGSGLAQLGIRISEDELVFLPGDWRIILAMADWFGREVEVIEGIGSSYGCHDIALVNDEPSEEKGEKN